MALSVTQYMESEIVYTDVNTVTLLENEYQAGDSFTIEYRHASTEGAVSGESYIAYTAPFFSDGYVQVKVTY